VAVIRAKISLKEEIMSEVDELFGEFVVPEGMFVEEIGL
jgi:hypothetical protein